jgi:hypothetical protein
VAKETKAAKEAAKEAAKALELRFLLSGGGI